MKTESSAGDLAQHLMDKLAREYGQDSVQWIEADTIGVEDENGVPLIVKVELA